MSDCCRYHTVVHDRIIQAIRGVGTAGRCEIRYLHIMDKARSLSHTMSEIIDHPYNITRTALYCTLNLWIGEDISYLPSKRYLSTIYIQVQEYVHMNAINLGKDHSPLFCRAVSS
jgi:hypothetical protein